MPSPQETIDANRERYLVNPGSVIRFPTEEIPYKMLLNFKEYSYISSQGGLIDSGSNIRQIDSGSVILPLPLQLNDMTGIDASSFSGSVAAFLSGGEAAFRGNTTDNIQAYSRIMAQAGDDIVVGAALLSGRAQKITAAVGTLFGGAGKAFSSETYSALSGKAINSFETMQFKGVKLKQHAFNWRLSPSNPADSEKIRQIVNKIKANILPSYVSVTGPAQYGTHALLKYPGIAFISFYGIDQEYYYKLKPALITAFGARFNGGEQLNVYRGGKPVVVELSMELTELTIHSADDYGGATYTAAPTAITAESLASVQIGSGRGGIPQ